jgi:exo-beta-1,3-glucanase (GH17 family)
MTALRSLRSVGGAFFATSLALLCAGAPAGCSRSNDGGHAGSGGAGGHAGGGGAGGAMLPDGGDPGAPDGGVVDKGPPRPLPGDFGARHGIGYSGYRTGESPESGTYPTAEEIQEDLALLTRGNWTLLRLWDCSPHAERVLGVIDDNKLDFKVMLGVWIAGPKAQHDAENQAQIEACVGLATKYSDIVLAVSVGNETLDSWSDIRVDPPELAAYILQVRTRVPQPVTTDDFFVPFTFGSDDNYSYAQVLQVAQAVDFLSLHVYAFIDAPYDSWDWQQKAVAAGPARATAMMDAALAYTKESIGEAAAAVKQAGLDLPIVIGETGWKTSATDLMDDPTEVSRAHPVNQKLFWTRVNDWIYGSGKDASTPRTMFFFEAFDEPWKGNDDGWGLFDTNRNAKYVVWDTFPDRKPANAPNYSDADAVYAP